MKVKKNHLNVDNQKSVTILCPVFNEEENVEYFFSEFSKYLNKLSSKYKFNFLFADNNSTDSTFELLKKICDDNSNVRILKYSRNFGYMKSLYTGFISSNDDACVIFDCDLQDPPELLSNFLDLWEEGYKVIYGRRSSRIEKQSLGFFRSSFRKMESFLKGYEVPLETGVWFLDKQVIKELTKIKFDPYLPGLISRLGFRTIGVPYDRKERMRGYSKASFSHYFSYATDGLISGTITPLRLTTVLGLFFSICSFLMMVYFLVAKIFLGAHFANGVAALSVIVLFGFGVNFIFLGILGEYIGRVYLDREISQPSIIEEVYPEIK